MYKILKIFVLLIAVSASCSSQSICNSGSSVSLPPLQFSAYYLSHNRLKADTNQVVISDKAISFGMSASLFRFPETYQVSVLYVTPMVQQIYLLIGVELDGFNKYNSDNSQFAGVFANLYLAHKWTVAKISNIYFGGGFGFSYPYGVIGRFLLRYDFPLLEKVNAGFDIWQTFTVTGHSSKYHKFPFVGFNLSFAI